MNAKERMQRRAHDVEEYARSFKTKKGVQYENEPAAFDFGKGWDKRDAIAQAEELALRNEIAELRALINGTYDRQNG